MRMARRRRQMRRRRRVSRVKNVEMAGRPGAVMGTVAGAGQTAMGGECGDWWMDKCSLADLGSGGNIRRGAGQVKRGGGRE
jgi:hypothetical protein